MQCEFAVVVTANVWPARHERHAPPKGDSMIEARDLFEAHLTVTDLRDAIEFYQAVVGLRLAHVVRGQAAFLWVGAPGTAMLGLWLAGSGPQRVTSHTAFRVGLGEIVSAAGALRSAGVTPLDFDGRPTDMPVVLGWMPAAAVYFRDPSGNLLEFIAMLPGEPRPDCGVVPWRTWEQMNYADPARHSSEMVM